MRYHKTPYFELCFPVKYINQQLFNRRPFIIIISICYFLCNVSMNFFNDSHAENEIMGNSNFLTFENTYLIEDIGIIINYSIGVSIPRKDLLLLSPRLFRKKNWLFVSRKGKVEDH